MLLPRTYAARRVVPFRNLLLRLLPVQVKLRFAGWDARWDEWHKLDEDRIRLLVQPPKAAGAGKGRKAIGAVGIGKGLRGVKRKVWAGHGGSDVSKPNKPLNKAKVDPEVQKKIAAVLEKKAKKAEARRAARAAAERAGKAGEAGVAVGAPAAAAKRKPKKAKFMAVSVKVAGHGDSAGSPGRVEPTRAWAGARRESKAPVRACESDVLVARKIELRPSPPPLCPAGAS